MNWLDSLNFVSSDGALAVLLSLPSPSLPIRTWTRRVINLCFQWNVLLLFSLDKRPWMHLEMVVGICREHWEMWRAEKSCRDSRSIECCEKTLDRWGAGLTMIRIQLCIQATQSVIVRRGKKKKSIWTLNEIINLKKYDMMSLIWLKLQIGNYIFKIHFIPCHIGIYSRSGVFSQKLSLVEVVFLWPPVTLTASGQVHRDPRTQLLKL